MTAKKNVHLVLYLKSIIVVFFMVYCSSAYAEEQLQPMLDGSILNLHYNFSDSGAIENHLLIFNKIFADNAINVAILTGKNSKYILDATRAMDKKIASFTFNHNEWLPREEDILKICQDNNIGVLVCNTVWHIRLCLSVQQKLKIPIVLMHHYHASKAFSEQLLTFVDKVQGIATVSTTIAEELKTLKSNHVLKIPHITHIAPFWNENKFLHFVPTRSKQDFFKQEYNITLPEDANIITMVAHLCWYKNQQLLIKATDILKNKKNKNIHVVLAGDGDDRIQLEQQVKELNLTESVHFLGKTVHIPELLYHSTLHTLSSCQEGLGVAHLEAACMKKPFIGATKTGIERVIKDGENGFIFQNNNAEDLANKIEFLLDNPTIRTTMGQLAYEHIRKHYSNDAIFDQWLKFLTEVCNDYARE